MARPKKARVFNLHKRTPETPAPALPLAPPKKPPMLLLELHDIAAGHVIGAVSDAQRAAASQQAACERVGDLDMAEIFAQKSATLAEIARHITSAFAARRRL